LARETGPIPAKTAIAEATTELPGIRLTSQRESAMGDSHILAIDQGTSATKCVLVDCQGKIVAKAAAPLGESYPQNGWVEQDGNEIWQSAEKAVSLCLGQFPQAKVLAIGLSTQRESALIWERSTGKAVTPLLSWQDQRTVGLRDRLSANGIDSMVRERSGLPLDPMFSALKLCWLLDEIDPDRVRASSGDWCMGTIDAFLIARLGGRQVVEAGNASRTQLLNVHSGEWDEDLLKLFRIPRIALPQIVPSIGEFADGGCLHPALKGVQVRSVMADSHSALFAHGAYEPGQVKATMGTGSSVMGLADGKKAPHPGMCLTIAWDVGRGPQQALEGNIRAAGSTLRWISGVFGISSEEAADIAAQSNSNGVCLVPAFNGLGAPWWDSRALGLISGLTLNTDKGALFAAAVESIAHQVADVVDAMNASGIEVQRLLLDGGPSRNASLREMLSTFIGKPVVHCSDAELSALGVAHLAGIGSGIWDWDALRILPRAQQATDASDGAETARAARQRWAHAVAQSRLPVKTQI
jgi:glycerol kinase